MLRTKAMQGALALAVLAIPVGSVVAESPGSADDSAPGASVPDPAPDSATPSSEADTPDDSNDDGSGGEPPIDVEFQVDMMLGLVPEDEINEYYQQQNVEQEAKIQACMNEAGFEYNIDTNNGGMSVIEGPQTDAEQLEWAQQWGFGNWTALDPENNPWSSQEMDEWVNVNEFVQELPEGEQNAWYETNNRCSMDVWNNPEQDPWRNPMVQQAMEDFQTWVENDPRMRDAETAWRTCMEAAGQPFADQNAMYEEVYNVDPNGELQSQFYESEAWKPESPDHEQWQGLVDNEIAVAVASAECSPPLDDVRVEVQKDLRPRLLEAWQDVDWDLPPETYPGEGDIMWGGFPGDTGEVPMGSEPTGTVEAPVALDLSGATTTTRP